MSHRNEVPLPPAPPLGGCLGFGSRSSPLAAATHNNFSFNFSILSVIYTCHATATELCPDPANPRLPSGPRCCRFGFVAFGFVVASLLSDALLLALLFLPSRLIIPFSARGVTDLSYAVSQSVDLSLPIRSDASSKNNLSFRLRRSDFGRQDTINFIVVINPRTFLD